MPATSRAVTAARRRTAPSATGSSTISTRSTARAKGHPPGPCSARQLSRGSQQRTGLVSALADARSGPCFRPGRRAGPGLALNRTYNQFWRHQLPYRHATLNCTGISVDVLRTLGWPIPGTGVPESARGGSGLSLLCRKGALGREGPRRVRLSGRGPDAAHGPPPLSRNAARPRSRWPRPAPSTVPVPGRSRGCWPQMSTPSPSRGFRSSRRAARSATRRSHAVGISGAPASDRRDMQIIPVPPRPFPDSLRDPDLVHPPRPASDYAVAAWGALLSLGVAAVLLFVLKQYLV